MTRFYLAVLAAIIIGCGVAFGQYGPSGAPSPFNAIPFQALAKTSRFATSTTSASLVLAVPSGTSPAAFTTLQIGNTSTTSWMYLITCATSSCTASVGSAGTSTTDLPIAPGAVITTTVPAGTLYVAAVLDSGTGTALVTPGVGL